MSRRLTAEAYVSGVLEAQDGVQRGVLARAITLVESQRIDDQALAQEVLNRLLPNTGRAVRVGITGVPGVGKSTFIEAFGMYLLELGHRVAVLAIDPSSALSGGSIMGDKTRMTRLSMDPRAFIRPSPSGLTLGGVARRTRESMLLCEAAGFDVVLVETVGVGQSETVVADMVDFFFVLMLPGAGDELQGIKKGLLELADLIAINKADGDNLERAMAARREYSAALRYLRPRSPTWKAPVLTVSAKTGSGLEEVWSQILAHRAAMTASGEIDQRRREQRRRWMWSLIEERLVQAFRMDEAVRTRLEETERAVEAGSLSATSAANALLEAFGVCGVSHP